MLRIEEATNPTLPNQLIKRELVKREPLKNDLRIVKTHNSLAQALIELSLEKGYETITIRDLTEQANIGYATFFRHYADKEALLNDVLKVFVTELTERLNDPVGNLDPAQQGKLIFEYVQKHKSLSQLLLASRSRIQLVKAIQQNHPIASDKKISKSIVELVEQENRIPEKIARYHWTAATISLIEWWLEQGMSDSPQKMGEIYRDLIVAPTLKAMATASAGA